ncbi:sigma factor-like helix-turn-helix DNA-binding protein [Streptomyces sp. NPDC001732]
MERADISSIGLALNSIKNRREIGIVVLLVIWGLSMQEAARRLGVTEEQARELLYKALSRLRHPSSAHRLREEVDGDFVARSRELRRWADAAVQAIVVTCTCGRKFLPENIFMTTGGRPKRYCSNACKQAAYRARKKQRDSVSPDSAAQRV